MVRSTIAIPMLIATIVGSGISVSAIAPVNGRPSWAVDQQPTHLERPLPFAATVTIPADIDATGATDVSGALNSFIESVPDSTIVQFPPGAIYLLEESGLRFAGRRNLALLGTGTTLLLHTDGLHTDSAAFWLSNLGTVSTQGIEIVGFDVKGDNPNTGTTATYSPEREGASGLWTGRGTADVTMRNITFRDLYGHGVLLTDDSTGSWTRNVHIHDNTFAGAATMGIAIVAAADVIVEDNIITDVGWSPLDIEPEDSRQGAMRVTIRNNSFSGFGWHVDSSNWWLAMVPDDEGLDALFDDIVVVWNRVDQGPATARNGNYPGVGGLGVRSDKANPKRNIVIEDNWTADDDIRTDGRPVMNFMNVDGLAVRGNVQPISGDSALVGCDQCTDVVVSLNQTAPNLPEPGQSSLAP